MLGIVSLGAFVPRLRLSRQAIAQAHAWARPSLQTQVRGERAYCAWDEDPITLAVEAARQALRGRDRSAIEHLRLASSSFPYDDLQNGSLVAAALGLRRDLDVLDLASGQRAVTGGLLDGLARGGSGESLLIASDAPAAKPGSDQEARYGAASVALLLGSGQILAELRGSRSLTVPLVDHFRAKGERFDYFWEERWIREEGYLKLVPEAVDSLLRPLNVTPSGIHHFVLASSLEGVAAAVARKLDIRPEAVVDDLSTECGYSGAAHPALLLARALERTQPGEHVMVVGFGQGCDVLLFQATEHIRRVHEQAPVARALARAHREDAYLKFLAAGQLIEYAWGMRAEKDAKTALTQQYRAASQVLGFVGGRCRECGTVQFPRLGKCVNPQCRAPGPFDDSPLSEEPATLLTVTSDWLQYSPSPPLNVGLVQFDNGARLLMEVVDADPEDLKVGLRLRPVFRIKERDRMRHYDRYFWKAAPLDTTGRP